MEILINNEQDKVNMPENMIDILKDVVCECLTLENKDTNYEVSITFVDNDRIRELNRDYRNIDKPTDVLSFPMYDDISEEEMFDVCDEINSELLLGDIVISLETALVQSEEFGHSLDREIAYLTAHSMFHLLGYDHMEETEKLKMREKEKEIMKRLKIFRN
ncbi:endoribonuclease YbeY [Gottschalkia purinilytica]|uniref:Endoribonuclease YbeY n=1 Tax=Gottschalkia purinilytica TaxID=1503 RepID=A0A0L0WD44_GOTPU|nr:rRNA maturation RNase YbeY [Gottschalkia purinilytica]KNF09345.1 endoribonuclease YbeY [Gottschalkia purinilytica]